jgi:hypothetical protein
MNSVAGSYLQSQVAQMSYMIEGFFRIFTVSARIGEVVRPRCCRRDIGCLVPGLDPGIGSDKVAIPPVGHRPVVVK